MDEGKEGGDVPHRLPSPDSRKTRIRDNAREHLEEVLEEEDKNFVLSVLIYFSHRDLEKGRSDKLNKERANNNLLSLHLSIWG